MREGSKSKESYSYIDDFILLLKDAECKPLLYNSRTPDGMHVSIKRKDLYLPEYDKSILSYSVIL